MQAMTLRLPDEVHDALRREAYESRRSMNAIILEALLLHLHRPRTTSGRVPVVADEGVAEFDRVWGGV